MTARRGRRVVMALLACIAVLAVTSLLCGRVGLAPGQVWRALLAPGPALPSLIVWELRLPRLLLALLVGATLGLSGAVLQGVTRNPLAEPGLLGVSAGAALGAVIAIYTGLSLRLPLATPLLGLAGALVAAVLTLGLGRGGGVLLLILAGAAVSGLMFAGTSLVLNLAPNPYAAYEISQWMMGSLADKGWQHIALAGPFMVAGLGVLAGTGRALDALALGEIQAASLGVDLVRLQRQVLIGTALCVGAATSVTGAIGFVGLLAPHVVRPLVGHAPRHVLLPAALSGAVLLLAADIATRVLPLDQELKLGVLTGLTGTPLFLWLVWRLKRVAP